MKNLGLKNNTKDIANLEDVKTPSNMVTTDSIQTISGAKTFTKTTTFQNDIKANGSAGTLGQVLISRGSGNSPKWGDVPAPSNVVTTNTAQNITGTKTFSNIQITEDAFYQDARLFFTTADGAQQSLSIGDTLSTSTNTSFILPLINDDGVAYELGTALYCHCIIASGSNAVATFQVFCNRQTEFTSLSSLYSSIMSNQTATVVYIPATGTLYSSSFASAQIVEAVKFMNSKIYICTRYLSKAASSESIQATDINDISIYECNRTSR